MARSTWEGSKEPDVQADPLDAATPKASNSSSMDSPSLNSKEMLQLPGRRSVG